MSSTICKGVSGLTARWSVLPFVCAVFIRFAVFVLVFFSAHTVLLHCFVGQMG